MPEVKKSYTLKVKIKSLKIRTSKLKLQSMQFEVQVCLAFKIIK